MSKTRVFCLSLAVVLLLSFISFQGQANPLAASAPEVKWSRVNIPLDGQAGDWRLAAGSDLKYLTASINGTLYAYATPSATGNTLFKSSDAGITWSPTGDVEDAIVDIATAPDDAAVVYYATSSNIYKSVNGGASFTLWPLKPGGAGSGNIAITAIDVTRHDANNIVAVATRDSDSSQYGGVYLLDEGEPLSGWIDTAIGNYDVLAVAFSPDYFRDRQLVAGVTDETDTLVIFRNGNAGWGGIIGNARIDGLMPSAVEIAFPGDYDGNGGDSVLFVALDAGGDAGDIYRVNARGLPDSSVAIDLNVGSVYNLGDVDITGLAVSGNTNTTRLIAGAANSARVYISTDDGMSWTRSNKGPTGQSGTYLIMAPDFLSSGVAYAATGGDSSAFSRTADGGLTWNQGALLDSVISTIVDLAPSPDYQHDNSLFMLTFDGVNTEHSLWRSLNGGEDWERMFTSALADADSFTRLALSPQYGQTGKVIYLAGTDGGNAAVWQSTDNGQTFKHRDALASIDAWAVADDNNLFLGSYNGSHGLLYHTTDGGLTYARAVVTGSQPLTSIVLSPDYEQERTILVSNTNGWVYRSGDNGASFQPLPADAASPPLTGQVTIAFDANFAGNNTIYAASSTADEGIYRFVIGSSTAWESIGALTSGGMLSQVLVSSDGTLYAANLKADGGMERCLNPSYPLGPTFETVTRGLEQSATLVGLWQQGSRLWSVDSQNTRLMTYVDSLTKPVILTSPPLSAAGNGNGFLEWETLPGATGYKWQLDNDTDFSTIPGGFENTTGASSVRLPSLDPAITYYWRVRATEPVLSPWSAKWSFTTSLGATVIAPQLYSPEAGASAVPVKPVFQWSAIAGAESHELLVADDVFFTIPVIVKVADYALPGTAWQSNVSLEYDTAYYWKVRASGTASYSAWSPVGAFTTVSTPAAAISPVPEIPNPSAVSSTSPGSLPSAQRTPPVLSYTLPPSPPVATPAQPVAIPDWALYLAGALLLAVVLLLVILVVLVADIRRS